MKEACQNPGQYHWLDILLIIFELKNFYLIIYKDPSINGRLAQTLLPYYGLIKNYGSPGGFYTFSDTASEVIAPGKLLWSQYGSTHKIQSFVGVFIYELGGLGILILILMGVTLKKEK